MHMLVASQLHSILRVLYDSLCKAFALVYSCLCFLFVCALISVFTIYVSLLLMGIALLGCVFCDPKTYHPHKSPEPRDSAAQTADRELQSAGPPIFLTSVNTPFGCRPRGLSVQLSTICVENLDQVQLVSHSFWNLKHKYFDDRFNT